MLIDKAKSEKNPYLVKKTSVTDTLNNLPVGKPVLFDCRDLATYSSVRGTIFRLNQRAGYEKFTVLSTDNGATYEVTRKA